MTTPRRSVLYMPGANERALEKAKTIPADALILDLEDAVAPEAKAEARERVCNVVKAGGYGPRELVIRVNGQDEPLVAATLAALLEEKAVDTGQRGIAVALNGAVVPRAAWGETALKPGDSVEIVRARQGG